MTRSVLILALLAGASAFHTAPLAPAVRQGASATCMARPTLPRRALLSAAFVAAVGGLASGVSAAEGEKPAEEQPKIDCLPACNKVHIFETGRHFPVPCMTSAVSLAAADVAAHRLTDCAAGRSAHCSHRKAPTSAPPCVSCTSETSRVERFSLSPAQP